MIVLDVEEYCHDCLGFDADVDKAEKMYVDGFYGPEAYISDTVIRCSFRNRCKAIKRYLEIRQKKEEKS